MSQPRPIGASRDKLTKYPFRVMDFFRCEYTLNTLNSKIIEKYNLDTPEKIKDYEHYENRWCDMFKGHPQYEYAKTLDMGDYPDWTRINSYEQAQEEYKRNNKHIPQSDWKLNLDGTLPPRVRKPPKDLKVWRSSSVV